MNRGQGIALALGVSLAALVWFATPAPWRGEWVYYTPYSSRSVDLRPSGLMLAALTTLLALWALRPRH